MMTDNQKRNCWIAIGIITVIICVAVFFILNNTKKEVNETDFFKREVKVKTDSLNLLKSELAKQQPELDSIKAELDSVKLLKQEKLIINHYHEKLKIINQYTVSDMQSHFDSLATGWIKKNRATDKSRNIRQH